MVPSKGNSQLALFAEPGDKVVKTSLAFSNSHGFDLNQNAYKIFLECLFDINADQEEFPVTITPVRKIIRKSGGRTYEYAREATKELSSVVITIDRVDARGKRSTASLPLMEFSLYEEGMGYIKSRFNRSQKNYLLQMTDEVDGLRSDLEKLENFVQFKVYYLLSQHFGLKESHVEPKEDLFNKLNIKRGGTYEEWRYFKRDLMNKIQSSLSRTRLAFEFDSDGYGTKWTHVIFRYIHKPVIALPTPAASLPEPQLSLPTPASVTADATEEANWPDWAKTLRRKGFFARTVREWIVKVASKEIDLAYIAYVVKRVEDELSSLSREKRANAMYGNVRDKTWWEDYQVKLRKAPAAAPKSVSDPATQYSLADIVYTEKEAGEQYAKIAELNQGSAHQLPSWGRYWQSLLRSAPGLVEGNFEGQRVIFRSK